MKLDIGVKFNKKKGFKGVDINPGSLVDVVADVRDLPFPDDSVEEIHSDEMIEHLPHGLRGGEIGFRKAFSEMFRVLKPKGRIELTTLDFKWICEEFLKADSVKRKLELIGFMFGEQNFPGNYHNMMYDSEVLEVELKRTGFVDVQVRAENGKLFATARKS